MALNAMQNHEKQKHAPDQEKLTPDMEKVHQLESWKSHEDQFRGGVYSLGFLMSDGLQTLFDHYAPNKILQTLQELKKDGAEITTYDLICALAPEKDVRKQLYARMHTKADDLMAKYHADLREGNGEYSSTFAPDASMVQGTRRSVGMYEMRDGFLGRLLTDKSAKLLEYGRAGGINRFAEVLADSNAGPIFTDALKENAADLYKALKKLSDISDKGYEMLAEDVAELDRKLKETIEAIRQEEETNFETYRAAQVGDLSKLASLNLDMDASQKAMQGMLHELETGIIAEYEKMQQRVKERSEPLEALRMRLGLLR